MPLDLRILTGASVPIYKQIADQVCHGVASGALASGEQLPSVRSLAESLVVNPNTVARAYNDLLRAGVVDAQAGKGVFVARRRPVYTKAERLRRLDQTLSAFVSEAVILDFDPGEIHEVIDKKLRDLGVTLNSRAGGNTGRSNAGGADA